MIVENRTALISAGHSKNRKSLNNPLVSHPNVTKKSKEKRIDKLDIVDYIRQEEIVTLPELMASVEARRQAGDKYKYFILYLFYIIYKLFW